MLYTVETNKALDVVCTDLQQAVTQHQFGVMSVHNLKETMAKKGVDFGPECRIFEICNPHQAKRVLEQQMGISTALPCRISVYEEGGKVKLSTMKPTAMMQVFEGDALQVVAQEVETAILEMMDEAVR